jgi:hypothetical protein
MRRVYFVTEGPHDVEVLGRLLSPLGAKRVQKFSELDLFWERLVPRIFPHEGDLLRRVPVPVFFQADEFSVAVKSAVGISAIPEVTSASLAALDDLPAAVGVLVDADGQNAIDVWKDITKGITKEMPGFDFGDGPGQLGRGEPRSGVFVLPNNKDTGTLETILLKCGEQVYPALIEGARAWISPLDPANRSIFVNKQECRDLAKPAGKDKAVVAAVASVLRPGKSVQVSIQDNRWISEPEKLAVSEITALQEFVIGLIQD